MKAEELFKKNYGISVPHSWAAYNGSDMVKFAEAYASQLPTQEVGVSEIERPIIKQYFKEGATLNDVHKAYTNSPELFNYAKALDLYIDSLPTPKREDAEICSCGHNLCYINKGKLYCNKCGGLIEYANET